jgi:tetratricopeptide (TPR) repeat protein
MLLLYTLVAHAAPLELETSPEARVVVLPRTEEQVVEIGVYGNRAPLREAIEGWRTPGLEHGRFVDRGGGTAFLVLQLSGPHLMAEVVPHGDGFLVTLVEGEPELHSPREVLPLESLFGELPRRPAPLSEAALIPLGREARTFGLDPSEIRLDLHAPEPRVPFDWTEELGPVASPTMEDVARWRNLLPELQDQPDLLVVACWRLAQAHRHLGLPREAMYYFRQGSSRGFPPAAMLLGLADSALSVERWDEAREALRQAWYRDAPEDQVLTGLGVLSLATGQPPPAETGRALAQAAHEPLQLLLAGELLLRDGYAEEAAEILQEAAHGPLGTHAQELAWVALGDAMLLSGRGQDAQRAYNSAAHGRLDSVLRVRELALRMTQDGVRRWPSWVPDLRHFASREDAAAADALYLLAQVHTRYADPGAVSEDLGRLWDLDPVSRQTDVPARLIEACQARILQLERDHRDAELVEQFQRCWREDLDDHLAQVDWVEAASRAWERLGFLERAYEIQRDVTTILAALGREDALALARLAHLQTLSGRPDYALETIAYTRRLPGPVRPELELVVGDAHEARGEVDEALAAWQRAATQPWLVEEAALRSGMLQLRSARCAPAVAMMAPRLEPASIPGEPPGELELLLARCEDALGRPEEAIGHAALALARAKDEWLKAEVKWFAAAIAARSGMVLPEDLRSDGEAFRKVAEEDDAHAKWAEAFAAWRRGQR